MDIIFGVIGKTDASKKLIVAGLSELRDKAAADNSAFWGVVGLTPESGDQHGAVLDWLIEERIAYDIVIHPDVADDLPDQYSSGADKVMKSKTVEAKVVSHVAENEGSTIVAFIGDEEPGDTIMAAIEKAINAGMTVYDICDGMAEVSLGEEDAKDEGDEQDFAALGEAADGGDVMAQETLTELADGVIDEDEFNSLSWTEVAEKLAEVGDAAPEPEPEKKAPAKKGAAPKKAASSANKWTEEDLDSKQIKELREIATAASIEGSGKMGFEALKKALIGVAKGQAADEADTAADEPEEQPKTAAKGKAAPKKTTDSADKLDAFIGEFTLAFAKFIKAVVGAN